MPAVPDALLNAAIRAGCARTVAALIDNGLLTSALPMGSLSVTSSLPHPTSAPSPSQLRWQTGSGVNSDLIITCISLAAR